MHSGPTWACACSCGSHILFMRASCTIQAGPTYYSGGTHVLFKRDPRGTHVLFRWESLGAHVPMYCSCGPPLGPTYYLGGTHALFRWGPHTIQVGPRIIQLGPAHIISWDPAWVSFLKKIYFFHYLKIQNIFNYSLYTNIIARLCILRSHAIALLLFGLCFSLYKLEKYN